MKSLWSDAEAARWTGDLGQRVYTSRLLGADPSLVLHGGGNTSLKTKSGDSRALYVKASGRNLARVEASDFVALDLECVLRGFEHGYGAAGWVEACTIGSRELEPSIETLLHAALPFRYVEHTHADSVLALSNVEGGDRILDRVYGALAPTVDYHDSGEALARACLETYRSRGTSETIGLVLRFHGAVAFADTARASYENMVRLATMAEDFLKAHDAWRLPEAAPESSAVDERAIAALRVEVSRIAGRPLVVHVDRDPVSLAFLRRVDLASISQLGPATPQHAFFTRRVPLLGRDVAGYARSYRDYLERHLGRSAADRMDCAPRIVLDPALGICAFGSDASAARRAAEVYRHDIEIISRASAHGTYRPPPPGAVALAEMEYGGFRAHA